MRVVFCGTPEFALPTLRRLVAEKFAIAAVITQPDRPKGRGLALTAPPVKVAAQELGLRVEQPEELRGESGRKLREQFVPEAIVIVGYGQIIPADLLELPKHGWINLHASLLPKYRGAAPVNWALIRGETVTGVTTMRIDAGLDTGPILLQCEEAIRDDDTAIALGQRLAEKGAGLMVETLRRLAAGTITPRPQDHSLATKAPLLKKEHGLIDWRLRAREIYNRVRGLLPWPGAFTTFRDTLCHIMWAQPVAEPAAGVRLEAAALIPGTLVVEHHQLYVLCGEKTWLRLEELQLAARKRVAARDFINGLRPQPGERFSPAAT